MAELVMYGTGQMNEFRGRTYYKKNSGFALAFIANCRWQQYHYSGGLVSTIENAVTYYSSFDSSEFPSMGSVVIDGTTWYYSFGEHAWEVLGSTVTGIYTNVYAGETAEELVRNVVAAYYSNARTVETVTSPVDVGSVYNSNPTPVVGETVTLFARPFPNYVFKQWSDGSTSNPRQITVSSNVSLIAEYQRGIETNEIYQYRCYVKDQLYLTDPPKAFMVVDSFDIKRDIVTNAVTTLIVLEMAGNVNEGDVVVVYDPFGTTLYQGVITSIENLTIRCSQMTSFYKGMWIYNVHPSTYLEQEVAWLLGQYAQGKIYGSTWTDPLVAQRLSGITILYVGSTSANLPTDLDDDGNPLYTQNDMEKWMYELYSTYGIIFSFEINFSGANYVTIKVPDYTRLAIGNNMFAIQNMSPITEVEETNRLIIFSKDKVYRKTYVATNTSIVAQPSSLANRFNVTNTKVVFSDDAEADLVAANLPTQMYNHKLTFDLIIKNFIYQFGDFKLGGSLDIYNGDDYYDSILTGYEIKKTSNQNIANVGFTCGNVRTKLTQKLSLEGL